MTDKEIYVTAEGLEKLKSDLEYFKTTKRKDIASRIASAKELGDLSENAEYSDAKEEQALVEGKILELEETLRNVTLIQKPKGSKTVVIGSHIAVVDPDGKQLEFDVVGSNEADPGAGTISNESPLGKAFLGRKVGDEVAVTVPKGTITYTLKKVS
ncbi:MAG: Transcription elongation factor [uncultured bacterium]|nr:MAG: Transcription elongation factor [uncultured bacterium]HBY73973.1 transcription elongation factor GreA [Candidatus Kerfeldbacteria bacterium]